MIHKFLCVAALLAAINFLSLGCAKPGANAHTDAHEASHDHQHKHDSWWCNEHGVPEEVCALCNVKLAADFKAKGDWCKEHDRPDSQCFVCHPEREAEFAAQYEAKYGKKPPKPESEEAKKS